MSARGVCEYCGHRSRFHVAAPAGYVAWAEWAEKKCRTHHQEPCPDCGRFTMWRTGAAVRVSEEPPKP